MTSVRDTFAQPRDPQTAIRGGKEGAWEYQTIAPFQAMPNGWRVALVSPDRLLIKRTIEERIY